MAFEYNNSLVYLVDDDSAILDSLTVLIKPTGLKTVCYESAEDFLGSYCPDRSGCLALDLKMPLIDGLELQEKLFNRNIHIPVIFISGNAGIADAAKAFKGGAVDFFEKPFNPNQLIECIFNAINKDIENRKKRLQNKTIQELFSSLSPREKEVLQLIINNCSSKEAAKKLDISHRTVEAHRARIMEKMQATSAIELVAMTLKYAPT